MKEWIEIEIAQHNYQARTIGTHVRKGLFGEKRTPIPPNYFTQDSLGEIVFTKKRYNYLPKKYNYSVGSLAVLFTEVVMPLLKAQYEQIMEEVMIILEADYEEDDGVMDLLEKNRQIAKTRMSDIKSAQLKELKGAIDSALDSKNEEKFKMLSKQYNDLKEKYGEK